MIKRIPVEHLGVGMYIHDINCSWRVRPLFLHHFKVEDERQIEEVMELGAREVYIDTTLGADLPGAPTEDEIKRVLEEEMSRLSGRGEIPIHYRLASKEELDAAQAVHSQVRQLLRGLMEDVRLGRQIEFDTVKTTLGKINDTLLGNVATLVELGQIRSKDDYTFEHSVGVSAMLAAFARTLGLNRGMINELGIGGMLHDIGKMKVPDAILNKPGRLTDGEFAEIKRHVEHGCELLRDATWVSRTAFNVMAHHHERYDGTGYPGQLRGADISMVGQMAAIADVYDAITSARVYHTAMTPADALRKLQEWSRYHFNEELVAHFIRSLGVYPLRTVVRLESGVLGIVIEQNPADLGRPVLLVVYDADARDPLVPYRLDLEKVAADRIVGCESADKYGIDVEACLKSL